MHIVVVIPPNKYQICHYSNILPFYNTHCALHWDKIVINTGNSLTSKY